MTDVRWRGLSHEQIYQMVMSGPGHLASSDAQALWPQVQQQLGAINEALQAETARIAGGWEGVAAEAAQRGLSPLGEWATQAVRSAQQTANALDVQADHVATMRNSVPPPPAVAVPEEPPPSLNDPGLDPYFLEDWAAADAQRSELAAQAVHAMETYTVNSAENKAHMYPFAAPPAVTAEPGPAGTVAQPGVGGVPPSPAGAPAGIETGAPGGFAPAPSGAAEGGAAARPGGPGLPGTPAPSLPGAVPFPGVPADRVGGGGRPGSVPGRSDGPGGSRSPGGNSGIQAPGGAPDANPRPGAGQQPGGPRIPSPPSPTRPGTPPLQPVGPPAVPSRRPDLPGGDGRGERGPARLSPPNPTINGTERGRLVPPNPTGVNGGAERGLHRSPIPEADPVRAPGTRPDGVRAGTETGGTWRGSPGGAADGARPGGSRPAGGYPGMLPMAPGAGAGSREHRRPPYLVDDTDAFADDRWFTPAVITPDNAPPRPPRSRPDPS